MFKSSECIWNNNIYCQQHEIIYKHQWFSQIYYHTHPEQYLISDWTAVGTGQNFQSSEVRQSYAMYKLQILAFSILTLMKAFKHYFRYFFMSLRMSKSSTVGIPTGNSIISCSSLRILFASAVKKWCKCTVKKLGTTGNTYHTV